MLRSGCPLIPSVHHYVGEGKAGQMSKRRHEALNILFMFKFFYSN